MKKTKFDLILSILKELDTINDTSLIETLFTYKFEDIENFEKEAKLIIKDFHLSGGETQQLSEYEKRKQKKKELKELLERKRNANK